MPRFSATTIELSEADPIALEKLLNRNSTALQVALRARIILTAANGSSHGEVIKVLGVSIELSISNIATLIYFLIKMILMNLGEIKF